MKRSLLLFGLLVCSSAFAADKTIHDFSSAGSLTGAEEIPIWQSSATKKTTITDIVGLTLPRTLAADTTVDLGTNNLRFTTNNTAMNAVIEGPVSVADWETFAPLGLQGIWALGTNGNGGGSTLGAFDFSNVANGAGVFINKARGTAAVPLTVQNGDSIGGVFWGAYDGTALQNPSIIDSVVTGVPSSGSVPAATVFYNGGSVGGFVESGRILDSGVLSWAHNITTTGTVAGSNLSGTNTGDQTTISGNAGTATALAANPTDCGAGTKATAIDASGNLTCSAASLTADVSGTLPVANGGTGITSLGSGVATWWGTPSSANLKSALTDELDPGGSGKIILSAGGLDIASGKTLTASNTLTFTGTDSSSVAFGAGGTVDYLGTAQTFSAVKTFGVAPVFSDQSGTRTALGLDTNPSLIYVSVGATPVSLGNDNSAHSIFGSANDALTVSSDTTYIIECEIDITTGGTSHTTALGFAGTATYTSIGYRTAMSQGGTDAAVTNAQSKRTSVATSTVIGTAASTQNQTVIKLNGMARVNAGGTSIMQVTFSADPTGTNQTEPNSYCTFRNVGSGTQIFNGPWN